MPLITIPRTDASPSRWPEGYLDYEADITKNENYHEKITTTHSKYKLFVEKVGAHLAAKQGHQNPADYQLSSLPEGYALFFHHKRQENGTDRKDIYLFGSLNVLKFRSPSEFFQHAEWLMNTSIPLEGTHAEQCTCKYAKNSAFQGAAAIGDGSSKRKATSTNGTGSKRVKHTVDEKMVQFQKESASVMKERNADLRGKHMYRRGEIVWLKIDPIVRPSSSTYTGASKIASIEWWPAIVTGHRQSQPQGEIEYDVNLPAKLHLEDGQSVKDKHYVRLESQLLPLVAIAYDNMVDAVLAEAKDIADRYQRDPKQFTSSSSEAENGRQPWKRVFHKKLKMTEARRDWDVTLVHYADAVQFLRNLHGCYCQTDGYADQDTMAQMMDDEELRQDELARIVTYFQGMWWGGERIWMHDLVRLTKPRSDLPAQWGASPGAMERGTFMRITKLAAMTETVGEDITRRLQIVGDLYELADENWMREHEPAKIQEAANGTGAEEPTWETALSYNASPGSLPPPPKGLCYRKLNGELEEVTADAFDVAGRVYPNLDEHPAVAHLTAEEHRVRVLRGMAKPNTKVMALAPTHKWRDNRYANIVYSHTEAVAMLDKLFGEESDPLNGGKA